MHIRPLPPKEYLNQCFIYSEDGKLTRKARPREHFKTLRGHEISLSRVADKQVGTVGNNGYLHVGMDYLGKQSMFAVHRVIWVMHNGEIPKDCQIDHIDTNKINNKIENLRLALHSDNMHNLNLAKSNTSGVKGVSWSKRTKQWQAQICFKSVRTHLGYFKTIEEAETVLKDVRLKLHTSFTNHG